MPRNKSTPTHTPPVAPESPPVLGIDVSKLTLDTCLLHTGKVRHQRFANSPDGIAKMLAMLQSSGANF